MAYLLAAIFQRPERLDPLVVREVQPDQAPEGTPITIKLTVTNQGAVIGELALMDILPGGMRQISGDSNDISYMGPAHRIALEYTVEASRGQYDQYTVRVYARDDFGLFESPIIYKTAPRLIVQPRYPKLDRIKIRPPQTRGFAGPIA